ncbi:MAG: LysR family transcriptional regulator [Treponema sp.]|jgi:DNA-binding transcriptional LysR family regulator|nr:LysR family transcriptional regulator [Treponema sp.]
MTDLKIQYFLAVVRSGPHFSAAAQALYVSQPALSKQIKDLEEELGFKLLDRSKKNAVKLTAPGSLMYEYFTRAQDELARTIAKARLMAGGEAEELKIGVLEIWDIFTLLPQAKSFDSLHPGVMVGYDSINLKAVATRLLGNHYDLVFSVSNYFEGMKNIAIKHICESPMILLYSRDHRLAGKEQLHLADFKDDTLFVLAAGEASMMRLLHESYCKAQGFVPRIKTLSSFNSIIQAIKSGRGAAFADQAAMSKNDSSLGCLVLDQCITVSALWKKDNPNKALQTFIAECVQGRAE